MNKEKKSDLTLKILALALAIFMWSYVMNNENPEINTQRSVELEFINKESLDREGLVVMDHNMEKISVEISGKKKEIDKFASDSINAYVDLSGYTEGKSKVPVKVSLDKQMDSIRIVDYNPKEINVTFDKLVTQEKKITLRPVGELKETYVLGDLFTKSETVLLKGPRTWVEEVSEAVAFVDLEGRTKDIKITTPVRLLDDQGNDVEGVEKTPLSIDVNIPILRSKKVGVELVTDVPLPEEYEMKQLVIDPSTVVIKGREDILGMRSVKTKVVAVEDLINNRSVDIELDLPDGVELVDESREIKASMEMVDLGEKELSIDAEQIEIKNLKAGLSLSKLQPEAILIKIKGDRLRLDAITPDKVSLYIDLEGLEAGSHSVEIKGDKSKEYNILDIRPVSIQVELEDGEDG